MIYKIGSSGREARVVDIVYSDRPVEGEAPYPVIFSSDRGTIYVKANYTAKYMQVDNVAYSLEAIGVAGPPGESLPITPFLLVKTRGILT
ncbi:MAG: hypothetical protein DRO12_03200 [Thermoprotei archaeon]|nr:MAG: hypothetical protein DRO12_03200 [Thermoprotei archaeon]